MIDGTDAVMLSGETANGAFPINAVNMMSRVCIEAESVTNYDQLYVPRLNPFPLHPCL